MNCASFPEGRPRFRGVRFALTAILAVTPMAWAPAALANDWGGAVPVTIIETTYMPDLLDFQTSTTVGTCTAGSWLHWYPHGSDQASRLANMQAVLATLMAAKMGGKRVMIFGDNANCTVQFIWLVD